MRRFGQFSRGEVVQIGASSLKSQRFSRAAMLAPGSGEQSHANTSEAPASSRRQQSLPLKMDRAVATARTRRCVLPPRSRSCVKRSDEIWSKMTRPESVSDERRGTSSTPARRRARSTAARGSDVPPPLPKQIQAFVTPPPHANGPRVHAAVQITSPISSAPPRTSTEPPQIRTDVSIPEPLRREGLDARQPPATPLPRPPTAPSARRSPPPVPATARSRRAPVRAPRAAFGTR